MPKQLVWKKKIWTNEYQIFDGKLIVGLLKVGAWGNSAYAELRGHMLRFQNKGFWKQTITVLSIEGDRVLGHISCSAGRRKATITIGDREYQWSVKGWTSREWVLETGEDSIVGDYTGWTATTGTITFAQPAFEAILASMYLFHQYRTILAAAT